MRTNSVSRDAISPTAFPLAAKYADEWNAVYLPPADFAKRCAMLDEPPVGVGSLAHGVPEQGVGQVECEREVVVVA